MIDSEENNQESPLDELLRKQKRFMIFFFLFFFVFVGLFWIYQVAQVSENPPAERTLYRVLAEDYGRQGRVNFACERLKQSEDSVDLSGNIGENVLSNYVNRLDEARTAFLVLSVKNPEYPKYKDYLDYTNSLIEWAKVNKSHQSIWFDRLYYSACF